MEVKTRRRSGKADRDSAMSRFRIARWDLTAIIVLIAGLLISLAVLGQDFTDPGIRLLYPSKAASGNLLGPPGAWIAGALYRVFGLSTCLLLACWFVSVVILFQRRRLAMWTRRLLGWILLIPCVAYLGEG